MARYFKTANGQAYNVSTKAGLWSFFNYCKNNPGDTDAQQLMGYYLEVPAVAVHYTEWLEENARLDKAKEDANAYYEDAARSGIDDASNNVSHYVDNNISRENVEQDQQFQTEMRDTSLLSTAQQLEALGLSSSNVVSVGGAGSGVSSQPASTNMRNAMSPSTQMAMNKFNQKMSLAKSMVSAAGSMASSGIYGASLGAVKSAGAKIAASASHSGLNALKALKGDSSISQQKWDNLLSDLGSI